MPQSTPPLTIGFNHSGDHANPDPYFVDIGQPIPVQADEDCFVIFDKPSVLPSGGPSCTWPPYLEAQMHEKNGHSLCNRP